ncbi:MAG: peptidoglycan-binding protein [Granulosicoccus sp.]
MLSLQNRLRTLSVLLLVFIAPFFSAQSHAQSVANCMSAKLSEALSICQSIINSGSRNVDVYWKLSSAQYQDGQQALASRTLSDALRLHPGNAKLETLREIISVDSTEQQRIAESAKRNQASVDQGALKIACLTKAGSVGISACERRLELTNQDGDRIRKRLALLKSSQTPTQVARAPKPTVPQTRPSEPVATIVPTPPAQPSQRSAGEEESTARQAAYKNLVAGVQQNLNAFGFNAGRPDGVPGANTRRALTSFYQAINAPVVTSITDDTLLDLQQASRDKVQAQKLLAESQRALGSGDAQLARNKLGAARRTSALLDEPLGLETNILTALNAAAEPKIPVPSAQAPRQVAQTPVQNQSQQIPENNTAQFDSLMGQINILRNQIQTQQSTQASQLDQLRGAL